MISEDQQQKREKLYKEYKDLGGKKDNKNIGGIKKLKSEIKIIKDRDQLLKDNPTKEDLQKYLKSQNYASYKSMNKPDLIKFINEIEF